MRCTQLVPFSNRKSSVFDRVDLCNRRTRCSAVFVHSLVCTCVCACVYVCLFVCGVIHDFTGSWSYWDKADLRVVKFPLAAVDCKTNYPRKYIVSIVGIYNQIQHWLYRFLHISYFALVSCIDYSPARWRYDFLSSWHHAVEFSSGDPERSVIESKMCVGIAQFACAMVTANDIIYCLCVCILVWAYRCDSRKLYYR